MASSTIGLTFHFWRGGTKGNDNNRALCLGSPLGILGQQLQTVLLRFGIEVLLTWSLIIGVNIVSLEEKSLLKLYVYLCTSLGIFIIYSSDEGYISCLYFLPIWNTSAINMTEQVFTEQDVESFEHVPRNCIIGSYGSFLFRLLRILHTDYHSDCTN